jgi:hypothetical protein
MAGFQRICDKCCEAIDSTALGYVHRGDGSPLCEGASPEIEFQQKEPPHAAGCKCRNCKEEWWQMEPEPEGDE